MRPLATRIANHLKDPAQLIRWLIYQYARGLDNDVLLLTFPSSGTHWLRTMLAQSLIEAYGLPESINAIRQDDLIPTFLDKTHRFKYNGNYSLPRIQQSHSPYNWFCSGRKSILLVRDLRDTLVSHYRVAVPYLGIKEGFGEFIRGRSIDTRRHHDLLSRIDLLNSWQNGISKSNSGYLVIHYESLRDNTTENLEMILEFIGMPQLDPEKIKKILEVGSVKNMQKLEESKHQATKARKVSGSVSRYQEYFSDDDKQYFMEQVNKRLVDAFGYDYNCW